jgi:hypothetical protein
VHRDYGSVFDQNIHRLIASLLVAAVTYEQCYVSCEEYGFEEFMVKHVFCVEGRLPYTNMVQDPQHSYYDYENPRCLGLVHTFTHCNLVELRLLFPRAFKLSLLVIYSV